ncbi:MAG: DUF4349 domain-containing protein [Deltaproteobacteria bacterium]|nr:DUF4349 domain-containing protein [Deltaproteobacteria bacterium]
MKKIFYIITLLLISACSSMYKNKSESADTMSAAQEQVMNYEDEAPPQPSKKAMTERAVMSPPGEDISMSKDMMEPPSMPSTVTGSGTGSGSGAVTDSTESQPSQKTAPMIVYRGYLKLQVRRLKETMDEISKKATAAKGYIESMSDTVIVVRIPGDNFEETITEFSKMGELLSKTIEASEVTAQFSDLLQRKNVAEASRERLLELLAKETDSRQRLRILQEIQRLTEQIESISSTLKTIQNLVDYFTITIELVPVISTDQSTTHNSPFTWINNLSPYYATLNGKTEKFKMKLPDNFVTFSKSENFTAQSADTTIIRGAITDNNPKGTPLFWNDAINFEMEGRGEKLIDNGIINSKSKLEIRYSIYKNDDIKPRWYFLGVTVKDNKVFLIEIFYPNEDSFNNHNKKLLEAIKTLEVQL